MPVPEQLWQLWQLLCMAELSGSKCSDPLSCMGETLRRWQHSSARSCLTCMLCLGCSLVCRLLPGEIFSDEPLQ